MPATLTIRDETTTGAPTREFTLDLLTERITVRELIRSRVYQEVKDYNLSLPEYFRGLVQPTETEATLNGYRLPKHRQIDWEKQYAKALEAFHHNGFLILVDDQQVTDLDEEIVVAAKTAVTFMRLLPLVGG